MEQGWIVTSLSSNLSTMELLDTFKIMAENQLLKYAVSKQMFCPVKGCDRILDYKRAVLFEFSTGYTTVICSHCATQVHIDKVLKVAKAQGVTVKMTRFTSPTKAAQDVQTELKFKE